MSNPLNPLPDDTTEKLLNPGANSLGSAIGTVFDAGFHFILDPLRKYNITKDAELAEFSREISKNINKIPVENRDGSKMKLVLKAIDDSKYRLDNDFMRKAFARLLTKGLDNRHNDEFYPVYSDILSNMSVDEAVLIKRINDNLGSQILTVVCQAKDKNSAEKYDLSKNVFLFDNSLQSVDLDIPIKLLENSGLIEWSKNIWLSNKHYIKQYENFESKVKNEGTFDQELQNDNRTLVFERGFISLTEFGKSFTNLII